MGCFLFFYIRSIIKKCKHPHNLTLYNIQKLWLVHRDWQWSITLETTLTSRGYYAIEGERERERKIFFFFCPTYGPKRKFRKSREKPYWKKVKGPVLDKEWGWEAQSSCVSNVYVYFTSIGTHRYLKFRVYFEKRGACCIFIYKVKEKVQVPTRNLTCDWIQKLWLVRMN